MTEPGEYARLISWFIQRSVDLPPLTVYDIFGGRPIVLYGAGGGFDSFSRFVVERYGLVVDVVLDRKFDVGVFRGVPAFHPERFVPTPVQLEDGVVVVTIFREEFYPEVFGLLARMGFANVVPITDVYECYLLYPSPEVCGEGYYARSEGRILEAMRLLSDGLSLEVFARYVSMHVTGRSLRFPVSPPEEQYFPSDVLMRKGLSRYVCCGAYDGDTVGRLVGVGGGELEALACFEPDPGNFGRMLDRFNGLGRVANEVLVSRAGVYDRRTWLRFGGGRGANSFVSEEGGDVVRMITLDEELPERFRPTLISMDVEGSELKALRGAEGTIRDHVPDLAVCVYHSPDHAWEVPLYLNGLGLGYRFYMRNYSGTANETVLYATSERGGERGQ